MPDHRKNDEVILNEIQELKTHFIEHTTKIDSVLFGQNGYRGLCDQVNSNRKDINKIKLTIAKVSGGAIVVSVIVSRLINKLFAGW